MPTSACHSVGANMEQKRSGREFECRHCDQHLCDKSATTVPRYSAAMSRSRCKSLSSRTHAITPVKNRTQAKTEVRLVDRRDNLRSPFGMGVSPGSAPGNKIERTEMVALCRPPVSCMHEPSEFLSPSRFNTLQSVVVRAISRHASAQDDIARRACHSAVASLRTGDAT